MSTENNENENEYNGSMLPTEIAVKFKELADLCTKNNVTLSSVFTVETSENSTGVGVKLVGIADTLKQAQCVPELAFMYAALYLLQHSDRPGRILFSDMSSTSIAITMALESVKISQAILTDGPLLTNREYMEMLRGCDPMDSTCDDDILKHVDDMARKMGLDT